MVSFSLSLAAMDILREQLKLTASSYPFEIPSNGVTMQQRADIRNAVFRDLEGRGLAYQGQPVPEVERALTVLAHRDIAVAAIGIEQDQQLRALVASAGRRVIRALQVGEMLQIDQPTSLVYGTLDLLPDEPTGQGQSVTITAAQSTGDDRLPSSQSHQTFIARTYLERPRKRTGQLSMAVRAGTKETWPVELTWFDTDVGRYISYARTESDGRQWITYAPADKSRIAHMLTSAIAS
jgi:hypothetical protein